LTHFSSIESPRLVTTKAVQIDFASTQDAVWAAYCQQSIGGRGS
jgi:hypothetical protein